MRHRSDLRGVARFFAAALLLVVVARAGAVEREQYVVSEAREGAFPLAIDGRPAPLVVAADDWPGVRRVAKHFHDDVERVTGTAPTLTEGTPPAGAKRVVLIGTLGHSTLVDRLVAAKKLDAAELKGKREKFIVQSVEAPLPGIERALVIAGSDKRGTIYGMFDLSAQIGVSPWYWWADVPPRKQSNLYVLPGAHTHGEPKVEYRGIFINDEAPALAGWMAEKFGGCNSKFYDHVFELILRLKGNFLWPAMWGRSIDEDDPESARLADEYGVVLSTSHHEPMMRAHVDWERLGAKYATEGKRLGPWNYEKSAEMLHKFWAEGIRRTNDYERLVTVGMRGDGDMPMSEGANIALLEKIVAEQRKIIEEETGKPANETPQVWALYKEVQDYYDRGMRVPDDVALFLCDDNWGNIRKLPKRGEPPHPGGYGIYYHFDYVGGPRNYKWLNTNPLPRIWEQLHLAYEYNARKIWLVNVGDIKPMEFPIEFFLDYAWDPEAIGPGDLAAYTELWAERQFGAEHAAEIADLLAKYPKYNSRRKPELLSPDTFSLENFGEADRIVADWNALADRARKVNDALPAEFRDAYFQLVLYPIEACANLNEMYVAAAKNHKLAKEQNPEANEWADRVEELFQRDAELSRKYNKELAGGKWSHMMDQTHIGYTMWQEPPKNAMPKVERVPADAKSPVTTEATPAAVKGAPAVEPPTSFSGFVEADGYVSIEAEHTARRFDAGGVKWGVIPDFGRTLSGVTVFPTNVPQQEPGGDSARLEYRVYLAEPGKTKVRALIAPTQDFTFSGGLEYAVSFDDQSPQRVNINADTSIPAWERDVANNISETVTEHELKTPGEHVLKFWMIDPGVVLEKLVIHRQKLPKSYLGPPESRRVGATAR